MARTYEVFISDEQWERIGPFLPKRKPSARGGRPRVNDRACLEGILWVQRSGARWRDLPERYPSPTTCWRRLCEWEGEGVLVAIWHSFLDTLDERGLLDWDAVFVDASFSPAKKGRQHRKNQAGKGYKVDGGGDGQGVPLACRTESASPAEVTLVEGVIDQVPVGENPTPLIADRAYDSDPLRENLLAKGWDLVCPHRRGRVRPRTQDGR